ncbi:MAG: DUF2341 domain-containing protein [Bacteroidota bacterium]
MIPTQSAVESGGSTTITVAGYESGATLQWQSSTDNITFTDIGGATSATLNTGALTQATHFRVQVTMGCTTTSSSTQIGIVAAGLSGYDYRREITLDGTKIVGSHTDFPFLVKLTGMTAPNVTSANGYDIAFTSSDGTTLLPHEIHFYDNGTGEYMAWVKMNMTAATDETLYVYYGNSSVTTDPSSTAVWDANFGAVLHLQESGSGSDHEYQDATSNNVDGTGGGIPGAGNSGRTPARVNGLFGYAQDFDDGTSDIIRLNTLTDVSWTAVTAEMWIYAHDGGDDRLFGKTFGTGCADQTWLLRKTGTNVSARLTTDLGNVCGLDRGPFAQNAWHHLSMTWDSSTGLMTVFIDGVALDNTPRTGNDFDSSPGTDMPSIGNTTTLDRGFDGLLQEARVSNVARSEDWLRTTYLNQLDAGVGGFISTIGPEEEVCSVSAGSLALSNATINAGGSTTILASGYEAGATLQWQSSTDNVNFTNITGATSDFLNTGPLSQTTYFRLAVNKICTEYSSAVTVTVGGVACTIASGSVTADRDEVFDGESTTLTLLGYEPGATFQWQSSTDNVSFTDIPSATSTTLTTGALYQDTYFRVTVTNGCSLNTPTIQVAVVDEFISGYTYRKKITLDGASIFGSHTDFPALISISSDADLQAGVTNSNGYDILFTNGDGTTVLDHELQSFNSSTGQLVAWVKTDLTGATNKEIYMYYGNATISADQSTTDTWSAEYGGVWHFEEDPSGSILDATSNNHDGTTAGSLTRQLGSIGFAYDFPQTSGQEISIPDVTSSSLDITGSLTLSAWVRPETFSAGAFDGIIDKQSAYRLFVDNSSGNKPGWRVDNSPSRTTAGDTDLGIAVNTDWHLIAGVYDDASNVLRFYFDGAQLGSDIAWTYPPVATNGDLDFGVEGGGDLWDGMLDEIRIQNVVRSADWIKTEYFNQNDPASFLTFGPEETCVVEAGTLAAADDLVASGETTMITVSGYSDGATLQWESSTDNATFTPLGGETSATLTTPTISQTTYFRVRVTKSCDSYTDAMTISIDPTSGYVYRKKITLEGSEIAGNHTDFPVLVRLASDADLQANVTDANGYDIIFTDADGKTALPFELEKYVAGTGELVAWVKTDLTASSSKEIYMYYGNSTVSGPSDDVANTWNSNYEAVLHFNSDARDAIGTVTSPTETSTSYVNGIIGGAVDLEEGSSAHIDTEVNFAATISSNLTLSSWVNVESATNDGAIIGEFLAMDPTYRGFLLWMDDGTDGFAFGVSPGSTLERIGEDYAVPSLVGNWHHVVGTWDGSTIRLYVDGAQVRSASVSGTLSDAALDASFGSNFGGGADRLFDGSIDEGRILDATLDANWVLTEYNNQRIGSTFLTLGAEESDCDFDPGVASAASSDIYSGENTVVSVSGFTVGSTIQWQQSSDGGDYTNVTLGSGEATPTYTTGALTSDTYFRAAITKGACTNYSSPVLVSITPPFIPNYSHRMKMTIPASKVSGVSNLTDFPLLVDITNDSLRTDVNGGNILNGSGFDIQFADESGNLFSYERETYDATTGYLRAWVRIPVLSASSDTEVYLYYGSCDGTLTDPSTSNAWNTSYKAVYHMEDAGDQTDSKGANTLTNNGTDSATGQIGSGRDLEADDSDNLRFPSDIDLIRNVGAITVSSWIRPESSGQNAALVGLTVDGAASTSSSRVALELGSSLNADRIRFGGRSDDGETFRSIQETSISTSPGTWSHVVGVLDYSAGTVRIYVDGEQKAFLTTTFDASTSDNTHSTNGRIGAEENGSSRYFDGLIDEVRILDAELTADWIKTEYDNQLNPSSFYTLATEETQVQWHGSTNTEWSETTNWSTCVLPSGETVVRIPDVGNDPVLDMNASVDHLIIESSGVLSLGSFTLEVAGDLENNGVLNAGSGLIRFTGDGTQRFSGNAVTMDNMMVNKAAGSTLELYQSMTVEENLTLSSGMISLNGGDLLLSDATMAGGGKDAFIATPTSYCLRQNVDNTDVLFPVGSSTSSYTPAILNNSGTPDIFCIRVVNRVFKGGLETGEEFSEGVVGNTWFIDETTDGSSNVSLTLEWRNADQKTNFVAGNAMLTHYNEALSSWESKASTAVVDKGEGRFAITATGLNDFSPHGVGSDVGILPIELIFFDATYQRDEVLVTWATASEIDNDFFSVERGTNGEDFEVIANIPGQGDSNERVDYQYTDQRPLPGGSYYRLKQTDFDGTYTHSEIEFVFDGQDRSAEIAVFPNASDGINFTWSLSGLVPNTQVEVKLFNLEGAEIVSQVLQLDSSGTYRGKGFEKVRLRPGMYLLKAVNQGQELVHRLIVH